MGESGPARLRRAKLPKIETLEKSRRELLEKKKALYDECRKAQADIRQAAVVKANIDHLLGMLEGTFYSKAVRLEKKGT